MKDRSIKLLRLFVNTNTPLTVEYLSNYFLISKRSIYYEISEINEYLKEINFSEVKNLRGKGYILNINKEERSQLNIITNRIEATYFTNEERLLDLIFSISLEEKVFLVDKEEELKVSKSSLDEDSKKIKDLASEYDIKVVSDPKLGMKFIGNEKNIRLLLFSQLEKCLDTVSWQNRIVIDNAFQDIVKKYISQEVFFKLDRLYGATINELDEGIYRKNIVLYTAIWLLRIKNSFLILNENNIYKNFDDFDLSIENFCCQVCENFNLNICDSEIRHLVFMLSLLNKNNEHNFTNWIQSQILALKIIKVMEEKTKIPFKDSEMEIQKGLTVHIMPLISRLRHGIQFTNPLKDTIAEQYSILFEAIKNSKPLFYKLTDQWITDDELAFLVIHFLSAFNEMQISKKIVHRAVVICHHGNVTGNILAKNLQKNFNIEILGVFSTKDISIINKLEIDVIFSTIPLINVDIPVLVLDPLISKENFSIIHQFLKINEGKVQKEHQNVLTDDNNIYTQLINALKLEGIQVSPRLYENIGKILEKNNIYYSKREVAPMIEDILTENNIIIKNYVSNWQSAIELSAEPLLKNGIITENYTSAMINAVENFGPYIVIGENLALAHARPEDGVNDLGLSVLIVKEGVAFNHEENDPVKIVFCLAAVDNISHLNIMKEIVGLINNRDKVNRVINSNSKEEIFENLIGEI